jgi:hypothetical protein
MRKTVFAAVVIVFLLVGLVSPLDTLARSTQPAAVSASLAAGTASVTNNVTIRPDSISLGSVFDANGQVSAGGKPLANASVALHMGDVILGSAETDQLGHYAISVPVGASYFPAALNGATVYTVVEPVNSSFISAPSVATDVAVDQAPLYAIIVVIIVVAVAVVLYLFLRRFRRKAAPATPIVPIVHPLDPEQTLSDIRQNKTAMPSKHAQAPVAASETMAEGPQQQVSESPRIEGVQPAAGGAPEAHTPSVSEAESADLEDAGDPTALKQARELFEQGNDRGATATLYDAALGVLALRAGVTLEPHKTHWEHYAEIEAAVPDMGEPLRTLTIAFERTQYGGKSLSDAQREAAIDAFRSINTPSERGASD